MGALGATGAAGLAGCGGQQATQDPTATSSDGGDTATATDTETATPTEVEATSETLQRIQELAYITNQTLPVLPIQEKLAQSFQTTDDWSVPSTDSAAVQTYWPTEWLPRRGEWTAKEGGDDDRLTLAQWAVPADSQYNTWNGKNFAEGRRLMFDRFMYYNLAEQSYEGYVVTEATLSDGTLTLDVADNRTWSNGDPVTATDVANQIKLDVYNGGSMGQFIAPEDMGAVSERVGVPDDTTVEIELAAPANRQILLGYLQPKYLVAHTGTYGQYVEALDSAGSEDERSAALSELTGATTPEPVTCGPFQFEDADTQRTLLTKFEDHPDADNVNFSEAEYLYKPQNQGRWNSLINGETDGSATLFMPNNQLNRLPDSVQVSLIPRHWGMGMVFNFEAEPVDDPRVRKAIAHVVDRSAVAKNSGAGTGTKVPVTYPSGLTGEFSGQIENSWLEGVVDQFDTYGREASQTERAAALLRDAGYTKSGGTWQRDGEPLRLPIKGPAGFSDWVAGARTAVSQLQDFGIEAEAVMKDSSTYWGSDYSNANFVVGLQGWANYNQTYPYFHYKWIFDSWDAENAWNLPAEFEAPVLHSAERSGEAVTPGELVAELAETTE